MHFSTLLSLPSPLPVSSRNNKTSVLPSSPPLPIRCTVAVMRREAPQIPLPSSSSSQVSHHSNRPLPDSNSEKSFFLFLSVYVWEVKGSEKLRHKLSHTQKPSSSSLFLAPTRNDRCKCPVPCCSDRAVRAMRFKTRCD